MIRPTRIEDLEAIKEIYNYYIENSVITFDQEPWTMEDAIHKMEILEQGDYPFICCYDKGELVGYYYLSSWNFRSAYSTTAEVTIYIKPDKIGQGYGKKMMRHMMEESQRRGFHSLIAAITIPNDASIALHEQFGFKEVSLFREVGYKAGIWCDVGHWQWISD